MTTGDGVHGIRIEAKGVMLGEGVYRITTTAGAVILTSGVRLHGIVIDDDGGTTSRTALAFGGFIKVTGEEFCRCADK